MVTLSCLVKKIKIWTGGKKVQFITENVDFLKFVAWKTTQISVINWTFFSSGSNFDFLREATQNDHIRLLYKFEKDEKIGCVGSCGYAPASVKSLEKKRITKISF